MIKKSSHSCLGDGHSCCPSRLPSPRPCNGIGGLFPPAWVPPWVEENEAAAPLSVERALLTRKKGKGKWIGSALRRRSSAVDASAGVVVGIGVDAVGGAAAVLLLELLGVGGDVGGLFGEDAYDAGGDFVVGDHFVVFSNSVDSEFLNEINEK
jgi:hypothetical protein